MADNSFNNLHVLNRQSDSGVTEDLDKKWYEQVSFKLKTSQQEPIDENKDNTFKSPEQNHSEEKPIDGSNGATHCFVAEFSNSSDESEEKEKSIEPTEANHEASLEEIVRSSNVLNIESCKDDGKSDPVDTGHISETSNEESNDDSGSVDSNTYLNSSDCYHESTDEHGKDDAETPECPTPCLESGVKVDKEDKDLAGDHVDEKQSLVEQDENREAKKEKQETVTLEYENQSVEGDISLNTTSKMCYLNAKKMADNIAYNTKVVYKVSESCSHNFFLQAVFFFSASLHILYTDMNFDHNCIQEYILTSDQMNLIPDRLVLVVAAVLFTYILPEPDLPGITVRVQNNPSPQSLGVDLRDTDEETSMLGQDGEQDVQTHRDSHIGLELTGPREGRREQQQILVNHCSADEIYDGGTLIHIGYQASTHTSGEGNGRTDGVTGTQIENVPNLQTSCITDISLNEEQTERKIGNLEEDLNAHELTLLSPDGNPTTGDNKRRETTDDQSPDANSLPEIVGQHSTSVTEQAMFPASPASPAMPAAPFPYQGRMVNVQSRADTFDHRWPHPHHSPRKMAEAGFYYTGVGDTTRCFCCGEILLQWDKDDDPFVEHLHHSPHSDVQTEIYRYTLREEDNGQQRLEMLVTNSVNEQLQPPGRPNPHGDQDQNEDERIHSEAIEAFAGTEYYQHEESTGIQESDYQSSSTHLSPRLHEHNYPSEVVHNGVERVEQIGMEAIDKELFNNYYLNTVEVGIVLSEGYSMGDIVRVVKQLFRAGKPVTLDVLRLELRKIGARRQN